MKRREKRELSIPPTPKRVEFFFKTPIIKKLEKAKLKWDWLKISKNEVADNVTYINFLLTKDVLIVPQLNRPEDEIAFNELSGFFPDYAANDLIKKVNANEITKFGGALNCISWTVKE